MGKRLEEVKHNIKGDLSLLFGQIGEAKVNDPVNQPSNAKKNFIAQNLNSTDSEIYVVCGKSIGGTSTLWFDLQWREIY